MDGNLNALTIRVCDEEDATVHAGTQMFAC